MFLHVGANEYRVVLSELPIYDLEGNELEGCAIEDQSLIAISPAVEPFRRQEVVEHEIYHCWMFHVPQPRTEEESAQLHSLISRQFQKELRTAGGPDVLLNLSKVHIQVGRVPRAKMPQSPKTDREMFGSADRIECATCGAIVLAGSVHTGAPIPHWRTNSARANRSIPGPALDGVRVLRPGADLVRVLFAGGVSERGDLHSAEAGDPGWCCRARLGPAESIVGVSCLNASFLRHGRFRMAACRRAFPPWLSTGTRTARHQL